MTREKQEFLMEIIEKQIGNIVPSQNYYKEGIESLNDYEFLCNCCLEIFEKYSKLHTSRYYSEKAVGEKAYKYLIELKEWLDDILEVEKDV